MEEKNAVVDNVGALKKDTKPKKVKKNIPVHKEPVHIDQFLGTAKYLYDMDSMQENGFKGYMSGNKYQNNEKDFIPYLEKYLGKGDK